VYQCRRSNRHPSPYPLLIRIPHTDNSVWGIFYLGVFGLRDFFSLGALGAFFSLGGFGRLISGGMSFLRLVAILCPSPVFDDKRRKSGVSKAFYKLFCALPKLERVYLYLVQSFRPLIRRFRGSFFIHP